MKVLFNSLITHRNRLPMTRQIRQKKRLAKNRYFDFISISTLAGPCCFFISQISASYTYCSAFLISKIQNSTIFAKTTTKGGGDGAKVTKAGAPTAALCETPTEKSLEKIEAQFLFCHCHACLLRPTRKKYPIVKLHY